MHWSAFDGGWLRARHRALDPIFASDVGDDGVFRAFALAATKENACALLVVWCGHAALVVGVCCCGLLGKARHGFGQGEVDFIMYTTGHDRLLLSPTHHLK